MTSPYNNKRKRVKVVDLGSDSDTDSEFSVLEVKIKKPYRPALEVIAEIHRDGGSNGAGPSWRQERQRTIRMSEEVEVVAEYFKSSSVQRIPDNHYFEAANDDEADTGTGARAPCNSGFDQIIPEPALIQSFENDHELQGDLRLPEGDAGETTKGKCADGTEGIIDQDDHEVQSTDGNGKEQGGGNVAPGYKDYNNSKSEPQPGPSSSPLQRWPIIVNVSTVTADSSSPSSSLSLLSEPSFTKAEPEIEAYSPLTWNYWKRIRIASDSDETPPPPDEQKKTAEFATAFVKANLEVAEEDKEKKKKVDNGKKKLTKEDDRDVRLNNTQDDTSMEELGRLRTRTQPTAGTSGISRKETPPATRSAGKCKSYRVKRRKPEPSPTQESDQGSTTANNAVANCTNVEDKGEEGNKECPPDLSTGRVEDSDAWYVESVVDYRIKVDKDEDVEPVLQYRTKWKDWPVEYNSWEPATHFVTNVPIEHFWQIQQEKIQKLNAPFQPQIDDDGESVAENYFVEDDEWVELACLIDSSSKRDIATCQLFHSGRSPVPIE